MLTTETSLEHELQTKMSRKSFHSLTHRAFELLDAGVTAAELVVKLSITREHALALQHVYACCHSDWVFNHESMWRLKSLAARHGYQVNTPEDTVEVLAHLLTGPPGRRAAREIAALLGAVFAGFRERQLARQWN